MATDEHLLAAQMRRERLAAERSVRNVAAASLSGPQPTKAAAAPSPRHKKKHAVGKAVATTDFIAYDPSSRKRRNGA